MDKEKKKFLRRKLGWYATRAFACFSAAMPLGFNYFMGRILGSIAYGVILRHRRIALENLSVAFPEVSLKKRKEIARNFFIFMAQGSFELMHFLKNPQNLNRVRLEGKEYLDGALSRKNGVIILTAHLGNFPLMTLKLAKVGLPVNIVVRPMRDERTGDYLNTLRTNSGVKTIFSYPRRECIGAIMRALRNNELVIMLMDQNFGSGGVWVNFFGKLAATPIGSIVLALRTEAAIVPVYIYRENNYNHCIKFFPVQELILGENKDETALLNAIKFTRMIEGWIKSAAFQWTWIHRRWKSRPSEKIEKAKFKIEQ